MIDFANNCSHIAYASQTEYAIKIEYKLEAKNSILNLESSNLCPNIP